MSCYDAGALFLVETIEVKEVTFSVDDKSLTGILRVPDVGRPVPALVFMGPMAGVKEQVAGTYADAMAKRGFITLAFDHRHFGHSDGEPRQYEHPQRKAEDLRTAARYVKSQVEVAPLRIGAVGVDVGAGYLASVAAREKRIKAWAGVAGYYHDAKYARMAMGDAYDEEIRRAMASRERYEKTGECETMVAVGGPGAAMELPDADAYYGTRRGQRPNHVNEVAVMSREHLLLWDAQQYAPEIEIPTMMVHSERSLSPALARSFYGSVKGPKQDLWVESQGQVDFYDDPELVGTVCNALSKFFRANM
jgi:fermentation-respiration switch protein FrsA (DUF1100 family)